MSAKPSELSLNILKNKFQKSKCKRLTVTNGSEIEKKKSTKSFSFHSLLR